MNIQEIVKSTLTLKEANMSEDEIVKSLEETFSKSKEEDKEEKEDHKEYEKEKREKKKDKEEREEGREEEKEEMKEKGEDMEKSFKGLLDGFKSDIEKSFSDKIESLQKSHKEEIETLQKSFDTLKNERPNFQHVANANVLEKSISPSLRMNEETGKVQLSKSKEREGVKSVLMQQFLATDGDIKKSLGEDIKAYGVNSEASISQATIKHLNSIGIEITQ